MNSFLLPHGLLYTTLISPFLLVWLLKIKKAQGCVYFILAALLFFPFHFYFNTEIELFFYLRSFALYFMLALFCKKTWQKLLCLSIAAWVGIARIYLVQHFLEDVIAGASMGVLLTLLATLLYNRVFIPRLGARHWGVRVSDV